MRKPDIIVFGGAFDPPHVGHVQCVEAARKRFPEARCLVVPAHSPASAAGKTKQTFASYADRMQLCKVAFHETHALDISSIESELPSPNHTLATLQEIQKRHPDAHLAFLIGQDQLKNFPKWHAPVDILTMASLIVAKRAEEPLGDLYDTAERTFAQLELAGTWQEDKHAYQLAETTIYLMNVPILPAASTRIRSPEPTPIEWLPPSVLEKITERGLYGF